jgi:hypothetical protein
MKVCILIGSTDISGGTYVIFEHALYLQSKGLDVVVIPSESLPQSTADWHPALSVLKFRTFEDVADIEFDLAISTWWRTVYELHRVNAARYCHFVQSIESWFYPDCEPGIQNLANSTYTLGLPVITEAKWIKEHLKRQFGTEACLVPNGCKKVVYSPDGPVESPRVAGKLRVLVEGPIDVDFKNVKRTIEILRRTEVDEVWLLTLSDLRSYPGVDRVFSRVPAYECGPIYRSCDVLVKLSYIEGMFGPPLEMFHCGGTAVVYDVTGHDEYMSPENAVIVPSGDEDAVIAALNRLKRDPALVSRLMDNARITAADWPSWDQASAKFLDALERIRAADPALSRERLRLLTAEFFRQYVRVDGAFRRATRLNLSWRHQASSLLARLARRGLVMGLISPRTANRMTARWTHSVRSKI